MINSSLLSDNVLLYIQLEYQRNTMVQCRDRNIPYKNYQMAYEDETEKNVLGYNGLRCMFVLNISGAFAWKFNLCHKIFNNSTQIHEIIAVLWQTSHMTQK